MMSEATLQDVISTYGDVLESQSFSITDESDLPFPKDIIAKALLVAIKLTTNDEIKEHLRVGYLALATFQALTSDDKKAITVWEEGISAVGGAQGQSPSEDHELVRLAEELSVVGDRYQALQAKVSEERDDLMRDLNKLG